MFLLLSLPAMSPLAPPTTGKKKEKARRVFGDSIVDDVLAESSLSYSPSPSKASTATSSSQLSEPTVAELFQQENTKGGNRSTIGPFDKVLVSEKENVEDNAKEASKNNEKSGSFRQGVRRMRMQQARSPLRRDLVKKTQDAINKASISVNHSLNAARKAKDESFRHKSKQTAKIRQEWQQETDEAKSFYSNMEKSRREILTMERQLSAHNSREKARRQMTHRQAALDHVDKESQFKSQVYREHQTKLKEEQDFRRRHSVEARAKIRANHRKGKEKLKLVRIEEDQAIFEERHQASVAMRNTARENAEKRRKSFQFRSGDARRIRELHAKMETQRQLEEHMSFELKRRAEKDAEEYCSQREQARRESLAFRGEEARKRRQVEQTNRTRERAAEQESINLKLAGERDADAYRKKLADERRESLAFRNKEGFRQRQEESQRQAKALNAEHASYELKWAGEADANAYQQALEQQRRQSLVGRNQKAREAREFVEQERQRSLNAEHESYELKWGGEKDAEAYQRKLEEQRRQSLAGRNLEARKQRELLSQQENEATAAEHASYELKWAGEKDAEAYERKMEQKRRESLAQCNAERLQHVKVMEELQMIAREKETESLVLKWAGEEDAKAYLAKLEEERRQSLQLRAKQTLHHRQIESEERNQELQAQHEDEELRSADQKDVEAYRRQCAERDRTSLEYRRKEARKQRLEEEERLLEQQQLDAAAFQLDSLARSDVEEYLQDCRQRRRMSLALRAKEKRRHAKWQCHKREKEIEQQSRNVRDRLIDRRYVELARQQERAKIAMDAIKHAGCSFNPFSGVLD